MSIKVVRHSMSCVFSRWLAEIVNQSAWETWEMQKFGTDLLLCYKIVHNLIPLNQEAFFKFDSQSITRRNNFKIKSVVAKSKVRYNFFTCRVVNIWNSLPNEAVCSSSVNTFMNCIKQINFSKFLIQKFDYLPTWKL